MAQAVTDTTALQESTKTLVIVETVGLILVSVVVTNVATNVFTQLLAVGLASKVGWCHAPRHLHACKCACACAWVPTAHSLADRLHLGRKRA